MRHNGFRRGRSIDLRAAGWRFILFGLFAPNIFATCGILVATAIKCVLWDRAFQHGAGRATARHSGNQSDPTMPTPLGMPCNYNIMIGILMYIATATARTIAMQIVESKNTTIYEEFFMISSWIYHVVKLQ